MGKSTEKDKRYAQPSGDVRDHRRKAETYMSRHCDATKEIHRSPEAGAAGKKAA